jgi:hypothetical protein
LTPEDVAAIVFWTKNASPLLEHLTELQERGYCFTFLYTINNYPRYVEPRVPDLTHTMKVVERLSQGGVGPIFRWRYDTIVLTSALSRSWHLRNFVRLCGLLSQFTNECIFSFCDYYKKTIRNMEKLIPDHFRPDVAECREMAEEMAAAAREEGIALISCAHDSLTSDTIGKARCIDPRILSAVVNSQEGKLAVSALKAAPTRKDCGCVASVDIGAYDTCCHGCVYCYANTNPEQAARNLALIKPESDCLDPRSVALKEEQRR